MTSSIVSKLFIHIHLKSWHFCRLQTIKNVSGLCYCWIFNIDAKSIIFLMRVPLIGFRLCKRKETFLNGKTCMVTAKPWFIYGIKILYERFFSFWTSIKYAMCSFISLLQCMLLDILCHKDRKSCCTITQRKDTKSSLNIHVEISKLLWGVTNPINIKLILEKGV